MSEEILPYLGEDLTEEFWRALESDRRLDQLYWNEEFLPFLRATIEALQQQRTALVKRVGELEQQRDAAVYILREAEPDYSDADLHLYMPDVIDDALKALGAEETK
jgi:hypothetical protein